MGQKSPERLAQLYQRHSGWSAPPDPSSLPSTGCEGGGGEGAWPSTAHHRVKYEQLYDQQGGSTLRRFLAAMEIAYNCEKNVGEGLGRRLGRCHLKMYV